MNIGCKFPLLALALLLAPPVGPTAAIAASNDIRWDDCSPLGTQNKFTACPAGSSESFIVGIIPPPGADQVTGFSAEIWFDTGTGLPPFWEIWPGGCSDGRLLGSFDFTTGPSTCADPWQGSLDGSLEISLYPGGPVRLRVSGTLPAGREVAMDPQTEYYLCRVSVRNNHPTCVGCEVPACFVLENVCLTQGSGAPTLCQGYHEVGTPWCTWQQAGPPQTTGCWLPVPIRQSTWGSLKSLYR